MREGMREHMRGGECYMITGSSYCAVIHKTSSPSLTNPSSISVWMSSFISRWQMSTSYMPAAIEGVSEGVLEGVLEDVRGG